MNARDQDHDLPPLRCSADVEFLHESVVERTLYAVAAPRHRDAGRTRTTMQQTLDLCDAVGNSLQPMCCFELRSDSCRTLGAQGSGMKPLTQDVASFMKAALDEFEGVPMS